MESRIATANEVLALMRTETTVERRRGGWYVCWTQYGKPISRRWATRGQDFYPVWHHKWGRGGTCTTALAQLIRWCSDRPVLSMTTWDYWMSPTVALGRDKGPEIIAALRRGGYPESTPCVLCGEKIIGGVDWWSLDGVTGPCCSFRNGCRQNPVGAWAGDGI